MAGSAMNRAASFINRFFSKGQAVDAGGHGFVYVVSPAFNSSNLARLALVRPYTLPKVDVTGRGGIAYARSIGGPQPAVAVGQAFPTVDPRGFGGGAPVPGATLTGPLIDKNTSSAIGV